MRFQRESALRLFCFFSLIIFGAVTSSADASLTQKDLQRIIRAKALMMDAEKRSADEIRSEFEESGYPQQQLQIYEAIAKTFRDIVADYKENTAEARVRLLDKIRMNMAYFQFGGSKSEKEGGSELNRLIQRKLKEYLPKDIWDDPNVFHSL